MTEPSDSPQRYPRTFSVTFNPLFGRPTVRDVFVEDASKVSLDGLKSSIAATFSDLNIDRQRMDTGKVKKLKYKHPNRPMNTAIELVDEEVMDDFRTNVAKSKLRTSQWQLFFTTVSTSSIPLESSTERKQVRTTVNAVAGPSTPVAGPSTALASPSTLASSRCGSDQPSLLPEGISPRFADVFCPRATSTAVETDETPQITLSVTQPAPAHDIPLAPRQALQRTIEQLRDRYSTENGVVWRNGVTDVELRCDDIMLKVWANCILENDYGASLDSPPVLPMFRGSRKKVKVARLAKTASGSGSELEDPRSALQTLHSNHPQLALQPNLTFSLDGIDKLFEAAVRKGKERASEEESLRRPSNMTIEVIIDEIVVDEFDRYELLELARTHRITPAALRCMTVETLVELGVHVGYAVQMISIAKRSLCF